MSQSTVQAEAITVGLMIPTAFTDALRKVAEENDGIEFGDLLARAIKQKIADYGGGAGIEKTYAAGCRRMRIVVFTEGSTPKERIDVTLP